MDPKLYLKKHFIMIYMEDAVTQLLSRKALTPKTQPLSFLLEYFKAVRNGSHIISREYTYISSTPHNRASFIKLLWRSYFSLSREGIVMKVTDYFPLLQLLCVDFPPDVVQLIQALLIGGSHEVAVDECVTTSFADFLYTFQVVFYFETFFLECEKIYQSLLMGVQLESFQTAVMGVVVVPHSDTTPPDEETAIKTTSEQSQEESPIEGNTTPAAAAAVSTSPLASFSSHVSSHTTVSTTVLTQSLERLCERVTERQPWVSCPSAVTIREMLADCLPNISLHSFLVKMVHSDDINSMIGVLPRKEDFLSSPPPSLTNS